MEVFYVDRDMYSAFTGVCLVGSDEERVTKTAQKNHFPFWQMQFIYLTESTPEENSHAQTS